MRVHDDRAVPCNGFAQGLAADRQETNSLLAGRTADSAMTLRACRVDWRAMNVTIREMTGDDYDQVIAFWTGTPGVGLGESDSREAMERFLKRNPGMSLVAEESDVLVGAVLCGHDGRRGYLHHLAVASTHRRHGLGRELVQVCLKKLRGEGIPRCNVFLFAQNADGHQFWKAAGYKDRHDLLLMQRATGDDAVTGCACNC